MQKSVNHIPTIEDSRFSFFSSKPQLTAVKCPKETVGGVASPFCNFEKVSAVCLGYRIAW